MAKVIKAGEILLNSIRYPIKGQIKPVLASEFPEKLITGDYEHGSRKDVSEFVISDQRGGILIEEMDEKKDANRYWWGNCETAFKGHITLPTLVTKIESIHKVQDTTNNTTEADATDTATLYALLIALKGDYNAHRVSTTYHDAADATNVVEEDDATTEATAILLANELKLDYNAHRSQSGVHVNDDDDNEVTTDDSTTEATAMTLANEIKADYNAHLVEGISTVVGDSTATFRPDADGSIGAFDSVTGSATHWGAVDEATADDATTMVWTGGAGFLYQDTETFNIPNHTSESGTISKITVHIRFKADGSDSHYGRPVIKTHGTQYNGDTKSVDNVWTSHSHIWTVNPYTGAAWTWEEIDDLEIGAYVRAEEGEGGATASLSQVYVVIPYTADEYRRTIFCNFNNKNYVARGTKLVKLNTTTANFDDVKTDFGSVITDLFTDGTVLYVFLGGSTHYQSMDTDDAFTATTNDDGLLATYGIYWDEKVFKISAAGQLALLTNPATATPTAAAKGLLPLATGAIKRLFTYRDADGDNIIYAGTFEGLWAHDYTNEKWVQTELMTPNHTNSGKGCAVWRDAAFISAGLDVHKYITGTMATIAQVGLDRDDGLPSDYDGEIMWLVRGFNEVFALVDASETSTTSYSGVYAYDGASWRCIWAASATNKPMHHALVSSALGYCLWYDHDDDIYKMPLHRSIRNPLKIDTDEFGTSGIHISPHFDASWVVGNKLALTLLVAVYGDVSSDESVVVSYRIDHSSTNIGSVGVEWTSLGTITSSGVTTYTLGASLGIQFKSIQFRFDLVRAAADTTETPDVQYAVLSYQKVIPPIWGWEFILDCTTRFKGYKAPEQLLDDVTTAAELQVLMPFQYDETIKYVQVKRVAGEHLTGIGKRGTYSIFVQELE